MLKLRVIWILLLLAIVGAVLLYTFRDKKDQEAPFAENDQARVVCSETCAARGQCGTLPDDRRVVLANENGPAVSLHDRLFSDDALVTITELNWRELAAARNGSPISPVTPFPHTFYLVNGEDKTAWVSEWCLEKP